MVCFAVPSIAVFLFGIQGGFAGQFFEDFAGYGGATWDETGYIGIRLESGRTVTNAECFFG